MVELRGNGTSRSRSSEGGAAGPEGSPERATTLRTRPSTAFGRAPGAPPDAERDVALARPTVAGLDVGGDAGLRVVVVPRADALRDRVEACIRAVYGQAFGAWDVTLPATLIAWLDGDDRPLCAAGLRTAEDGFFSETYLDAPIERVLAERTGRDVRRRSVFEITTLASQSAEVCPAFVRQLAAFGKGAGFGWCFFTATARLRALIGELGIPFLALAPADPARLPDPARWGSYYEHTPQVCAVDDRWLDEGPAMQQWAGTHA